MQVIPTLLSLVFALPRLAEAGVPKAPRTAPADTQTFSEFLMITPSTPSPTPTSIISLPTSTPHPQTTPGALSYGFVAIIESASTGDSAPVPKETPFPAFVTDTDANSGTDGGVGAGEIVAGGGRFVQTTYWACETFPKETHCGWHEPILEVTGAARMSRGGATGARLLFRAGAIAAFIVGIIHGL